MYTPYGNRAAAAYHSVGAQSGIIGADPHQLINMVFDGFLQAVNAARGAMSRGDVPNKGMQIQRAVRLLEEGLKGGLDEDRGGDLAANLRRLYDYCIGRLTYANLRNDANALSEVVALISPVADGWKQMGRLRSAQVQ